jgi:hypothetical protein
VRFLHDLPEDLSYLLEQLGHDVTVLCKVLPTDASDEVVLEFANEHGSRAVESGLENNVNFA